jgi:hypothetical protein
MIDSFGFDYVGTAGMILSFFWYGILFGFLLGFLRFIVFTWTWKGGE